MGSKLAVALGILMCSVSIAGAVAAKFQTSTDARPGGPRHFGVVEQEPLGLNPCWCMTGMTALQIAQCRQWRRDPKRPPVRQPAGDTSWADL